MNCFKTLFCWAYFPENLFLEGLIIGGNLRLKIGRACYQRAFNFTNEICREGKAYVRLYNETDTDVFCCKQNGWSGS